MARPGSVVALLAGLLALALVVLGVALADGTQAASRPAGTPSTTPQSTPRSTPAPVRAVVVPRPGTLTVLERAQVQTQRAGQLTTKMQSLLLDEVGRPVTALADARLAPSSCALLGRVWSSAGCSRELCLVGHEYAKSGANAETCRIGGREGASYGVELDFRRCSALHRVWIDLLNYCASDPHRDQTAVAGAAPCVAPWTTYVVLAATPGDDECLRPERVAQLQDAATKRGASLAELVLTRSRTQCAWRAGMVWRDGECVSGETAPLLRDNVLVVGDSITWRGTDELATLEPDWVIDGSSGRQVDALTERLADYRAAYGEPGGVVFALGTNGRSGWTEQQFVDAVDALPAGTPVLLVTPFRAPGSPGRPLLTTQYAGWMRTLAQQRPATCLADWRSAVADDGAMLVDGVHPTSLGEVFWAELVDARWHACLADQGLTSS